MRQRIENDHRRRLDPDAVQQAAHGFLRDPMRRLAGVGHVEMLGLDLAHTLFALRPRVAARGRVGVFGVQQQVAPQTPESVERRRPFGLLDRGERRELLHRQRAAFGLPVERRVLRIGADAVFPIGSKIAADGFELVSELLLDQSRNNRGRSPVAGAARRIWRSRRERTRLRRGSGRCFPVGCRTSEQRRAGSPAIRRFEGTSAGRRGSRPRAAAGRRRTTASNTGACTPSAPLRHPDPATRRANGSASGRRAAAGRGRRWRPRRNI